MRFTKGRFCWVLFLVCTSWFHAHAQIAVEEHWSPYDYPKEIPEGVKYHIIVKGDTLWDITATYLGDPLLWPQVYQANSYILDPHLIYPGDPIFLDVGTVVNQETISQSIDDDGMVDGDDSGEFSELEEFSDEGEEAMGDEAMADENLGDVSEISGFDGDSSEFVILPAGDRSDMECSTYIHPLTSARAKLPFDFRISGGENRILTAYSFDDVVYLNKGISDGVAAGEIYSVRRRLENVFDQNKKLLGAAVDQVGKVKIVAVQEQNATALVLSACYEIVVGDFLVPFEQEPIPLITEIPDVDRFAGFDTTGSGHVVYSEDNLYSFGKGHVTNIDLGIDRNIAPGDLFIIYRDNPSNNPNAGINLPRIYVGNGVALKARPNTTVMKVIASYSEIHVGDQVVPLTANSFVD